MSYVLGASLVAGGLGAAVIVAPTMDAQTGMLVRFAGFGAAAIGALQILQELRTGGGLAGLGLGALLGADFTDKPDVESMESFTIDVEALATALTAPTPTAGKPFVIPYVGRFVDPERGGTVERGLWSSTYPVVVQVENLTDKEVSGPVIVATEERYPFGDDETVQLTTPTLTLGPAEARTLTLNIPFGAGRLSFGGSPHVLGRLKFLGRTLDSSDWHVS